MDVERIMLEPMGPMMAEVLLAELKAREPAEQDILREIKASGISKSDMARMAPWVKEEIAKCGLSTEVFMQQTEVILRAFDKVSVTSMFVCSTEGCFSNQVEDGKAWAPDCWTCRKHLKIKFKTTTAYKFNASCMHQCIMNESTRKIFCIALCLHLWVGGRKGL